MQAVPRDGGGSRHARCAAARPSSPPVIDNLIEDHGLVAAILDGLTAILKSHIGYEELRSAT